ncbi:MAG: methyltransferase domain-containing protein [Solirubrobacteraceae bacterium]
MATERGGASGDPAGRQPTGALGRAARLIGPRAKPTVTNGYLDALGDGDVKRSAVQLAMQSRVLPLIYERAWRPILFGASTIGLREKQESRLMRAMLALSQGDTVLDVACGPGNTTRRLIDSIGSTGLVVGVDAAPAMLRRAVLDTPSSNVAYVRADAEALPFADGTFDGVSCFGALYLVDRPFAVIDELVRVLAPGSNIAILTSCHRLGQRLGFVADAATTGSGFRWFGPHDITSALEDRGLVDLHQEIHGVMQYVGATKP